MGIVTVVERAVGGGLSKARGGEWARRTSRRGRSARHPDKRPGRGEDVEVNELRTSRRTWKTSGATCRTRECGGGGSRGGGRKDLVRWEDLGVDC